MSPIALPIAELKPALTGLAKVMNRHGALPVLHLIKIDRSKDGWITLTATDLDQFVTLRLEQPGERSPLTMLAPYAALLEITRSCLKSDTLLVQSAGDDAIIIQYALGSEVAESKVKTLPVAEFPALPSVEGELVALSDTLRASIHQALECASTDATRLIINGAYVDISNPRAHYIVGTDGRHLFASNSFNLPLKESVLIPSHKFLGWNEFNNDGEWQLSVGPKEKDDDPPPFQISSRRWRFIGHQVGGNYPNWRQVVPDFLSKESTLEFDPNGFERIVRMIQRMPCDDPLNFSIGVEYSSGKVRLLGRSPNTEKWIKVEIQQAKGYGKEVTIFINRHLLTKAVRFGLGLVEIMDARSPVRFSAQGRQLIVMPVSPVACTSGDIAEASPESPKFEIKREEKTVNPATVPSSASAIKETHVSESASETLKNRTPVATEEPALDSALAQIEIMRADLRTVIGGLNKLGEQIITVARKKMATGKEAQSARQTHRSLQSVRI